MSQVTDVHDAFFQLLGDTLSSDYCPLPDPYQPDDNSALILQKAYGLGYGPAINSERQVGCKFSEQRDFEVNLINQLDVIDSDTTARANITKSLLEDAFLIKRAVEKSTTLSDMTVSGVVKFVGDTGILFLSAERARYVQVIMTFEAEYFEDLT